MAQPDKEVGFFQSHCPINKIHGDVKAVGRRQVLQVVGGSNPPPPMRAGGSMLVNTIWRAQIAEEVGSKPIRGRQKLVLVV